MKNFLVGRVLFPASNHLFNRKDILKTYEYLCRSETFPQEQLRDIQLSRLKEITEYCRKYVPYYRDLFRKISFVPREIRSLDDIRRIPALSRQDLIENYRDMVDYRLHSSIPVAESSVRGPGEPIPFGRFKKHKLVRNTSSGSTGAPTMFFEDGSRTALNWAYELRWKKWYGIDPGAREARMARLSTLFLPRSRSLQLRRILWNQMILPGTNLAEKEYAHCLERIRAFRPLSLWGYTSALTGLAEYMKREAVDFSSRTLKLSIGWAAPLYEHEKALLEDTFRCPATNIYSAREVGHVAAGCPAGSFHINQENLIVESEQTGNGEEEAGELLVTNLDISPMPFLRYRMGDIGRVSERKCTCGRTLQILDNLLGRTGEIFRTKDGRMISPNFWCRVFMSDRFAGQIRRFQVVYTKEKNFRILVVKGPGYSPEAEKYIKDSVGANISPDTRVDFEYVSEIRPRVSGKYQMVVNEAKDGSR
ncbi:MAG: phenylacetate--CoA ligase family protein [Candidatus Deferrimicrobiaceae bacterium]